MGSSSLWVDDFRPTKVSETILPPRLKDRFQAMVDKRKVPHLLLTGDAGMGKTTIALALCDELNSEHVMVHCSVDGNIDMIRTRLERFVSTGSLIKTGIQKTIIFDEADRLSSAAQDALKGFIERHQKNVRFIFTCNHKNKVIKPLHSRCTEFEYNFTKDERKSLAMQYYTRLCEILKSENIEFENKVVQSLIMELFPDFRKILTTLDSYAISGKIDSGVLGNIRGADISVIMAILKAGDWDKMRKWVDENATRGAVSLASDLWKHSSNYILRDSEPELVGILDDYQTNAPNAMDPNISLADCLTKIMSFIKFK